MIPSLGPLELGIILVIVIVIFGAGRVGELGGALGRGIREFKLSVKDEEAQSAKSTEATAPVAKSMSDRAEVAQVDSAKAETAKRES